MSIKRLDKEDYVFLPEFRDHDEVIKIEDSEVGLLGFVGIHKKLSGIPALGATRLWKYKTEEEALRDALRLSRLMSYKSAMAGLPYTGGKAALVWNEKIEENREAFFRSYAKHIEEIAGQFVTGTDMGVSNTDVDVMQKETSHVIGRGVDPGYFTAVGVYNGIEVCLEECFKNTEIKDRSFAIQGLGKTGIGLVNLLSEQGAKLFVTDIDQSVIESVKNLYPDVVVVSPDEIHKMDVDVFCPCASHSMVNEKTVKEFNCKIIAGSANNQLTSKEMGKVLYENNILYAPDYIINAGGIISVVDEFENGTHNADRIRRKLLVIKGSLRSVFDESSDNKEPPSSVADEIAQEIISKK